MMSRILVVEDNLSLAEGLAYNLRHEGHDVRIAEDGESGLSDAREWEPDLVILDLMLPRLDGYGVLAAIRRDRNDVPVIILSARGEEADKVRGFRLDADQYVTKPFGVLELLERVRSLLRRSASRGVAEPTGDTIRFGDVVVDVAARTATRAGVPCTLTPKAFDLLLALVARGGRVATRQELLKEVWGYGAFVLSRTVDSHIAELRRKLETDPAHPRHIVTVWKVGYRFEAS
ncbi:MAG TPA: response regulator transcription factor [Gemmatimonadaceae bacterium]|nr:response regulator transcription factor [Gemmatimonadaceae bacterium]